MFIGLFRVAGWVYGLALADAAELGQVANGPTAGVLRLTGYVVLDGEGSRVERLLDQHKRLSVGVPLLDLSVSPMTSSEIADLIVDSIGRNEGFWLGNHNLHSAFLWNSDSKFRENYDRADVKIIDGWPILQLARCGNLRRGDGNGSLAASHRVGSSDWLAELLDRGLPLRVLAIGGTAESSAEAARKIRERYPTVTWTSYDGYSFERTDDPAGAVDLDSDISTAQLVLVGMGMPNQELWISRRLHELEHAVVANVGGCLDYISGAQQIAPRWLGRLGLEWAYRLFRSPKRLFWRYLIEPGVLLLVILKKRTPPLGKVRASR